MNAPVPVADTALVVVDGPASPCAQRLGAISPLSLAECRSWLSDASDKSADEDAFETLLFVARRRLGLGVLTVICLDGVPSDKLKAVFDVAQARRVPTLALSSDPRRAQKLSQLGFEVHPLDQPLSRLPAEFDARGVTGSFDVIGDVHGCSEELRELLEKLGYRISASDVMHPDGRMLIFLGDLCDRGPDTPGVFDVVLAAVDSGRARVVMGNHDLKLLRKLQGKDVRVSHGLEKSLEQLALRPPEFSVRVRGLLERLPPYLWLDAGNLVAAHAGLSEELHGKGSSRARSFALYGDTSGETDEYGLPVRRPWALNYRGSTTVVFGHTPTLAAEWINGTICIDTGCVYGGALTALRYPERVLVSVPARARYYVPSRPLEASGNQ